MNKIREELEEAMSGIADKIETQRKLKAKYESVKREFEIAKEVMENALDTFEVAKGSVDKTVSKLRSCTEELDLMDNVDIEKVSLRLSLCLSLSFLLPLLDRIDFKSRVQLYS